MKFLVRTTPKLLDRSIKIIIPKRHISPSLGLTHTLAAVSFLKKASEHLFDICPLQTQEGGCVKVSGRDALARRRTNKVKHPPLCPKASYIFSLALRPSVRARVRIRPNFEARTPEHKIRIHGFITLCRVRRVQQRKSGEPGEMRSGFILQLPLRMYSFCIALCHQHDQQQPEGPANLFVRAWAERAHVEFSLTKVAKRFFLKGSLASLKAERRFRTRKKEFSVVLSLFGLI